MTVTSYFRGRILRLSLVLLCVVALAACHSGIGPGGEGANSPPRPKPKPDGFHVDPNSLIGLDEAEMRARMGAPASVREEPPAVIWRYASGVCRMDLYFYNSVKTNKLHSLTYVVGTTRKLGDAGEYCLRHAKRKGKTS